MSGRTGEEAETEWDRLDAGTLGVHAEEDILRARKRARTVAEDVGFSITDVTRIVTAVSELARNIHLYADSGEMRWQIVRDGNRSGLELVFDDDGPGISDLDGVLQATHSTSNGMGRGIQGTKKLMDDFEISTSETDGTTVTIRKWN